ncbi:MAG TPA: copper-binding protein [Paraburkholderia sp.]|jgi:Cu/Ag efflux protein CusF
MNKLVELLVAAGFLCIAAQVSAQTSYSPGFPMVVYGQVAKIDFATDVVSIRQVMPKNVGMAPITIKIKAMDDSMFSRIHEGDKVKAVIENVNGQPVVLKISRRPWPIQ